MLRIVAENRSLVFREYQARQSYQATDPPQLYIKERSERVDQKPVKR